MFLTRKMIYQQAILFIYLLHKQDIETQKKLQQRDILCCLYLHIWVPKLKANGAWISGAQHDPLIKKGISKNQV